MRTAGRFHMEHHRRAHLRLVVTVALAAVAAVMIMPGHAMSQPPYTSPYGPGFKATIGSAYIECHVSQTSGLSCLNFTAPPPAGAYCSFGGTLLTARLPRSSAAVLTYTCVDEGYHRWSVLRPGRTFRSSPFTCTNAGQRLRCSNGRYSFEFDAAGGLRFISPPPEYVALGDSYSSGEGAIDVAGDAHFVAGTDTSKDECHRSQNAYPFLVNRGLTGGTRLVFRACSGALVADLLVKLSDGGGWNEGAQLDAIAPAGGHNDDVRLVTLSVGGNDAGFEAVLDHCVHGFLHGTSDAKCLRFAGQQITSASDLLTHGGTILIDSHHGTWEFCSSKTRCRSGDPKVVTVPSLTGLYAEIHRRAPRAAIRVLLYPHLFGAAPAGDCTVGTSPTLISHRYRITAPVIRRFNALADQLDDQIIAREVSLAARRGIDIATADTRRVFASHSLCDSSSTWLNGLMWHGWNLSQISPFSFHPTAEGQAAFASVIRP